MEPTQTNNSDKFCHLHTHSTYSFTDGIGLPEQYAEKAAQLGQSALAITDHGNVSGNYKWYKECRKRGITPILGCELYVVETQEQVRGQKEYTHMVVLAKNNTGYRNLMKLVTKSWTENFYYKPRVTFQDIFDHQEGLIVLSGCLSSPFMKKLKEDDKEGCLELLRLFKKNVKDFYLEIQPIHFAEGKPVYDKMLGLWRTTLKKEKFKMVVTNDCHYIHESQSKLQEVMLCIQSADKMDNPERWKFDQSDFFLKTRKQMEESLELCFPHLDFTEGLDNTVKIAEMIDFEFPKAEPIKFPMPEGEKLQFLHARCEEGLERIGKEADEKYRERMEYELDLIKKKNFVDYFLVIHDLVNWAKGDGILVGPARGSAAGSLCCFLLRITEVDPLKYDLLFERFIDINRMDLPDIDIDFQDDRRHDVKDYLAGKYGKDKVGNLATFASFQGRSAIDDVGRVFRIPFPVLEGVKEAIIERSGGDSRASFTLEDTFKSEIFSKPAEAIAKYPDLKYAIELEGQYRQMGQHAAGIMISNEPLTNFCAIYKIKDEYVISMEYDDASDIGLLKIDLLGLKTLSVIQEAVRTIKERHNKEIDMYSMTLDDKKTYDGFLSEKLFGVFQFDGQAVNQVCRQIGPKNLEDLSAISALARPGPLNSGNATEYITRKNGRSKVKYVHEIMKNITNDSYGIVIYQEQVMRIMREIGKMSWKDTSEIRRLISKSQGVEKFNSMKDKFIPGALENGLSQEVADKIWEEMCHYGSWSFNKSHSVSYSIISYWTMWLKVHYPVEFYAASLAQTADKDKRKKMLKECKRDALVVLPIHINKSKQEFAIEDEGLRIGFQDIRGIGPVAGMNLVASQPYTSYTDFIGAVMGKKKRISETMVENLVNLGAFDSVADSHQSLFGGSIPDFTKKELSFEDRFHICPWDMDFGIEKRWYKFIHDHLGTFRTMPMQISELKNLQTGWDEPEVVICGVIYDKNLRDAREVSASKGKGGDMSKYESAKVLNRELFKGQKYVSMKSIKAWEAKVGKLKEGKDYEKMMLYESANFVCEDDEDFITVRLSHLKFPEYSRLIFQDLKAGDAVMIKGKIGNGIRMFFASKILSLRHYKESL